MNMLEPDRNPEAEVEAARDLAMDQLAADLEAEQEISSRHRIISVSSSDAALIAETLEFRLSKSMGTEDNVAALSRLVALFRRLSS